MPGDLPDALVYTAESAARMAFGTRFKKLPSAIFAKLSLPVLMVLAVFSFIYVTVVFAVAIPWLEHSVPGVLNVGFLTVTSGLGLTMYLCCVYCEPGRVPADWRPDNEAGRSMLELKRKGGARYCNKCLRHKPPRTHHCRVCNRCVLRMDHHCVWVNNCVGHRNYKSFFLFLFYITCACVHALAILSAHTIHTVGEDSHRSQRAKMIRAKLAGAAGGAGAVMGGSSSVGGGGGGGGAEGEEGGVMLWAMAEVACLTLTLPLSIALVMLFGWHCYLVINNKTTIEHYEGVRSKFTEGDNSNSNSIGNGSNGSNGSHGNGHGYSNGNGQVVVSVLHMPPLHPGVAGTEVEHPYSLGLWANLREILGSNVSCWLAPGCKIAGDGMSFANVAEYAKWKREAERKEDELTLLGEEA